MRNLVNGMHIYCILFCVAYRHASSSLVYIWSCALSNAYEAIVYVVWSTMFFGLAFDIKSKLTVTSAALLHL
jgi:hypothetical protein